MLISSSGDSQDAAYYKVAMVLPWAGLAACLLIASPKSLASLQGEPGEAQLIPLFYHNSHDSMMGHVDTEIRVSIPQSVGFDTLLALTTPHIEHPSSESSLNPVLNAAKSLNQTRMDAYIHVYCFDSYGNLLSGRNIKVSVDDVATIKASDLMPDGKLGYMIITTQSGSIGRTADFAFSADAWLLNRKARADTMDVPWAVSIPTFAMADAADTPGEPWPTGDNNVVESLSATGNARGVNAAPIFTGIRTTASGNKNSIRVIDLALAEPAYGTDFALLAYWNQGQLTIQKSFDTGFKKWYLPQPSAIAGQGGRGAAIAFSILCNTREDGDFRQIVPQVSMLAHDRGRFMGI